MQLLITLLLSLLYMFRALSSVIRSLWKLYVQLIVMACVSWSISYSYG